jgi:V/A-type H+-transporting ATPase subunit E
LNQSRNKGELDRLIGALKEEGVRKGEEEADRIVANARKEAAGIVEGARTEADAIVGEAHTKAQTTLERLEQQLSLALRDFLLKAKGQLEDLIALKPLREKAAKAFSDPEFIKKLVYEIISSYAKREIAQEARHLHITVPEKMRSEFIKEWITMMRSELKVSATLHAEEGLLGFKISAEGEGGQLVVDADSLMDTLKPFVSERFHYILDQRKLPTS